MFKRYHIFLLVLLSWQSCFHGVYSETSAEICGNSQQGLSLNESEYCLTPDCVLSAATLIKNHDPHVDPCDDFYSFACGGFISSTYIRDDQSTVNQFGLIYETVRHQLKSSLEKPIGDYDIPAFVKLKTLYRSCMDVARIEEIGVQEVAALLNETGPWPVLSPNWTASNFNWYDTLSKFHEKGLGFDYLINVLVLTDAMNSSARVITLGQPGLEINRQYYITEDYNKIMEAYFNYKVDIAVALGANRTTAKNDMECVLDFERRLAEISLPDEERNNASLFHNKLTIQELSSSYPDISWLDYINKMLGSTQNVTENEEVVNLAPSFFKNFSSIIQSTSNKTISNYLMWRVVSFMAQYLNHEVRSIRQRFLQHLTGQVSESSRSDICLAVALKTMYAAAGALFVRTYFDHGVKNTTEDLVKDIKNGFNIILNESTWLDDVTRARARNKSDAIVSNVAYPTELFNDTLLNQLYEKVNFEESYLKNILRFNVFEIDRIFGTLREPVQKYNWVELSLATDVNAYYHPNENEIILPAGILQGIFFNKNRPKYFNYGTLGSVIGHEVIHAFDVYGRQFDQNGNAVDWWEQTADQNYKERSRCFVEQYGNITVPFAEFSLPLDGGRTLEENIADNGGLRVAYRAYQHWVATHGVEKKLPGLTYNTNQLFWMAFANPFCSKQRPYALYDDIVAGNHPPDKYRINLSAGNMPEFRRDWNCTKGAKMVLEKTCCLW